MIQIDVAIAGCGIAGLSAALLLHRQGHEVTIYERFAEPAPLGSGLMIQPTGMAVLAQLGLAGEVILRGAPVARLFGQNQQGEVVLDARYSDLADSAAFGLGIHRASLFGVLYDAALAVGITIAPGHAVQETVLDGVGRRLVFADGTASARFDLIVDALGVATPLAPPTQAWLPFGALWTSLPWPEGGPFNPALLEQRYNAARRMVGILPTGSRNKGERAEMALFWSLRSTDHARWEDAGIDHWKQELVDLWPECEALTGLLTDPAQMTFARYAHRTIAHPVEPHLIHIGDAWHSASPQLGQGANMALLDAWALARGLAQENSLAHGLDAACALRRGHVRLYQRLTATFTPLYQSQSALPALVRDVVLAPLSRVWPGPGIQAALVAGLAGSPLGKLGLNMPDYAELAAISRPPPTGP